MSYKGTHKIVEYFEYVVPPLEGLWWQEGREEIDYNQKEQLHFISIIRLPDFAPKKDDEGLCVQCMHIGSYDEEPTTVELMHKYMEEKEYDLDIKDKRYHHEVYLSDPQKM